MNNSTGNGLVEKNHNHHPDQFPMQNRQQPMHQQAQNPPPLLNQNHWAQMVPQNQNQQFNPSMPASTAWQSQPMHTQSVPNSMPQLHPQGYPHMPPQFHQNQNTQPFDLASIVPQQIMQDFLRLSTPVGQSPNDDTILAQALYESKRDGKTYRQALEGLHGVNNHAANLWKDYYLDHHDRFDVLVSRLAEQPKMVKKPFATSKTPPRAKEEGASAQVARKRHVSPSPPRQAPKPRGRPPGSSQAAQRKRAAPPAQAVASTSSTVGRPPKRPRATFNSLSAPLPTSDVPGLMPPQADIPLPDPPSRSPSPPTVIQAGINGNRYTKEDRDYFINFLLWRMKNDPSLTKRDLCEQLYEKAPHHSATSWASHWHQRHQIADKILATYRQDYEYGDDEEDNDEEQAGNDDDDAESEAESAAKAPSRRRGRAPVRPDGTIVDFGDANVDTEEDEADMGEPGTSFTRGDWCILARFIAKNHWDEMPSKERWDTFTDTYETKRSGKCWAEFYRRNESAILRLSKRYSPGANKGGRNRRARPSWTKDRDGSEALGSDEDGDYETDNGDG
ncbi:hypothetical protein HYDPIDRAFT_106819 [Hydnomerulius pinastri MD-312]|nr:hypothetical protein HYDPIDRAFT_106819 [Hydnomerulius pinastri MD-312]